MSLKHTVFLIVMALPLAGCTVQPLYQAPVKTAAAAGGNGFDPAAASSMSMQSTLSTVAIKPVETRAAQTVRNKMIFLFGQGRGEPRAPAYYLALTISQVNDGIAAVQAAGLDVSQPSARALTMTGSYVLSDASGAIIGRGTRMATANYDVPSQGFAERSALLDAETRAGNELGELLHLAVAQAFAAKG